MTLLRSADLVGAASRMEVLAISRRVAEAAAAALAPLAWRAIRIAARPEEDALLRLLGRRDDPAGAGGPTQSGES
jgi:uroporphyrinogen-III synthase